MLKTFTFTLLCASALAAQTVPDPPKPPACLSGPVTLGSVTMTCSLMDTDPVNGGSDFSSNDLRGGAPIFQVKLSSSDPDVIGFRIGVTFLNSSNGPAAPPVPLTAWASVGKSPATYAPTPPPAPSPYCRYTFLLGSPTITGIQVQELKASSSQTF